MFLDRVTITVKAGDGGAGALSFRREKFVPRGGPDGGDGGNGGDIILVTDNQMSTLLDYRYRPLLKAERGRNGEGANRTGKSGKDLYVKIPCGTLVYDDDTDELIADLVKEKEEFVIAKGGRGGRGNARFATPTNRAPRKTQPGEPGEERNLRLDLKLIADVGLVGKPNAGKSTLLSVVSAARPEIANYPFTTLKPHLGMVRGEGYNDFVMADIPGLIEGASEGKGLGHQFLRHVERTKVLVFLIESIDPKPQETYNILLNELESFNPELLERPRLIVRSKDDLGGDPWEGEELRISSATNTRVRELLLKIQDILKST